MVVWIPFHIVILYCISSGICIINLQEGEFKNQITSWRSHILTPVNSRKDYLRTIKYSLFQSKCQKKCVSLKPYIKIIASIVGNSEDDGATIMICMWKILFSMQLLHFIIWTLST